MPPSRNRQGHNLPSSSTDDCAAPIPSPTDWQSRVLDVAMSRFVQEILARQGEQRLTAIQFDHLKAVAQGQEGQVAPIIGRVCHSSTEGDLSSNT